MPRLFTGIQLPAELVTRLAMLEGGIVGARWLEPENYHITLRFIGDIDNGQADRIADTLDTIKHRGFFLTLDGLDVFGSRKHRSLHARVAPEDTLSSLQAKQEYLLQQLGLAAEHRKFTPHVTLARFNNVKTEALARYLSTNGGFTSEPFRVDQFVLFSARQTTGGGPYVVEQAYDLAG